MLETIEAIAAEVGGRVYRHYSGRGMYGAQCLGVECGDVPACIEAAACHGLTGARWDNMGCDYIVYWPKLADAVPVVSQPFIDASAAPL